MCTSYILLAAQDHYHHHQFHVSTLSEKESDLHVYLIR